MKTLGKIFKNTKNFHTSLFSFAPESSDNVTETFFSGNEELEILDPVSYEVIGTEKRGVIHSTGLLHKGSNIFIFNEDESRILLQARSSNKTINPGLVDYVAEHLKPGETYEEAAVRGLKEELGIEVEIEALEEMWGPQEFHEFKPNLGISDLELTKTFKVSVEETDVINFDEEEVEEAWWMDLKELVEAYQYVRNSFTSWFQNDFEILVTQLPPEMVENYNEGCSGSCSSCTGCH